MTIRFLIYFIVACGMAMDMKQCQSTAPETQNQVQTLLTTSKDLGTRIRQLDADNKKVLEQSTELKKLIDDLIVYQNKQKAVLEQVQASVAELQSQAARPPVTKNGPKRR